MSDHGLFERDVLIVDQFVSAARRGAAISSEKRLMLAVLENALHCYYRYVPTKDPAFRELFDEAAEWIACTSNEGLFSFENISETLGIDPAYLRRGLSQWCERLDAPATTVDDPDSTPAQPAREAG